MGRLERIWIKRAHRGPMDPVASGVLEAEKGLVRSANYGGRRQVTIISAERWAAMMDELKAEGVKSFYAVGYASTSPLMRELTQQLLLRRQDDL